MPREYSASVSLEDHPGFRAGFAARTPSDGISNNIEYISERFSSAPIDLGSCT